MIHDSRSYPHMQNTLVVPIQVLIISIFSHEDSILVEKVKHINIEFQFSLFCINLYFFQKLGTKINAKNNGSAKVRAPCQC